MTKLCLQLLSRTSFDTVADIRLRQHRRGQLRSSRYMYYLGSKQRPVK
jgi:hypothetical protein